MDLEQLLFFTGNDSFSLFVFELPVFDQFLYLLLIFKFLTWVVSISPISIARDRRREISRESSNVSEAVSIKG